MQEQQDMVAKDTSLRESISSERGNYPLEATASALNDRLGLYLSEEQQRGFAAGLLVGTALGAALLAWNLTGMVRKRI